MAERVRFELTNELPRCRFSRPVLSTAQPSLRFHRFLIVSANKCQNISTIIEENPINYSHEKDNNKKINKDSLVKERVVRNTKINWEDHNENA